MFADRRVLIAITALIALGTVDASASPIHRCHQHGCRAHEPWRSDLTGPIQPSLAGGTCTIPLVVGSFSGRVMYSSLGRGFSADHAVSRAADARTW